MLPDNMCIYDFYFTNLTDVLKIRYSCDVGMFTE